MSRQIACLFSDSKCLECFYLSVTLSTMNLPLIFQTNYEELQASDNTKYLSPGCFITGEMSELCSLCESTSDEHLINVTPKERESIVVASHERADGREYHIKNVKHLLVHPACRKLYTRQNSIISYLRSKSVTP